MDEKQIIQEQINVTQALIDNICSVYFVPVGEKIYLDILKKNKGNRPNIIHTTIKSNGNKVVYIAGLLLPHARKEDLKKNIDRINSLKENIKTLEKRLPPDLS